MKLIKMVDFVLEQMKEWQSHKSFIILGKIELYAKLLKQPLELWMFSEEGLFEYNIFFSSFSELDISNSCIEDLLTDDFEYVLLEKTIKQLGL